MDTHKRVALLTNENIWLRHARGSSACVVVWLAPPCYPSGATVTTSVAPFGGQRSRGTAAAHHACSGLCYATQRIRAGVPAMARVAMLSIECFGMASASWCHHSSAGIMCSVVFCLHVLYRRPESSAMSVRTRPTHANGATDSFSCEDIIE